MVQIGVTRWAWCVLLALVLAACGPIKLISDYDEKLDQGVSDIQRKVESILTKIERSQANPSLTYAMSDYTPIKEELNVLLLRAKSTDHNQITVNQLYTLGYSLLESPALAPDELRLAPPIAGASLQTRHSQSASLTSEDSANLRIILNNNFRSIIKFEIAKKRGEAGSSDKK